MTAIDIKDVNCLYPFLIGKGENYILPEFNDLVSAIRANCKRQCYILSNTYFVALVKILQVGVWQGIFKKEVVINRREWL